MKFNQITKQCTVCFTEFKVRKYREHIAKFCSKQCHNKLQFINTTTMYKCGGCQKNFTVSASRSNKKFCSMECRTSNRASEQERRSKQKALQKLKRGNNSSRALRNWIFKLKEPKCQCCGYDKRKYCIDLHHIDNNPNNNILENIAILCVMCHRELHQGDLENAAEKGLLPKNSIIEYQRAY